MPRFPNVGPVLTESGTGIPTSYTGNGLGTPQSIGVATKARFVVTIVGAAGTTMTTFTCKLQGFDQAPASGPADFVSVRDDNGVTELEHAFAVVANAITVYSFSVDPKGFDSMRVVGRATGASAATDSVTVTLCAV